jgi:hypothetical protein
MAATGPAAEARNWKCVPSGIVRQVPRASSTTSSLALPAPHLAAPGDDEQISSTVRCDDRARCHAGRQLEVRHPACREAESTRIRPIRGDHGSLGRQRRSANSLMGRLTGR